MKNKFGVLYKRGIVKTLNVCMSSTALRAGTLGLRPRVRRLFLILIITMVVIVIVIVIVIVMIMSSNLALIIKTVFDCALEDSFCGMFEGTILPARENSAYGTLRIRPVVTTWSSAPIGQVRPFVFTFVALFCSLRKRRRPCAARPGNSRGRDGGDHPRLLSAVFRDLEADFRSFICCIYRGPPIVMGSL